MSSSRLVLRRALGAGKKLNASQQTSTQLSTLRVSTMDQPEKSFKYDSNVSASANKHEENMIYMSFACAESDFAAGAVVGEVPKSKLRMEAEERIMNSYSFSSPESDFLSMSLPEMDQMNGSKIGKGLSFASAESDFCAGFSMPERVKSELEIEAEKSIQETYSFASAENDFLSMDMPVSEHLEVPSHIQMSFSSPESDFALGASAPISESLQQLQHEAEAKIDQTYSYSGAESDFATMEVPSIYEDEVMVPASLSFASPESDFVGSVASAYGAIDMGLGVSRNVQPKKMSIEDAISSSHTEPRVITEASAPFKIVHANEAWKEVYQKNEGILGHTLAMANLKALGRHEVQSVPTKLGSSQLKVQPIDGKYLLNVLDGYKKEGTNISVSPQEPKN